MNNKYISIILFLVFFLTSARAQNRVGINTDKPKATLHVEGDVNLQLPRTSKTGAIGVMVTPDGFLANYIGINNLFYAAGKNTIKLTKTETDDANDDKKGFVVPWGQSDIIYGLSAISLDTDGKAFTIKKPGLFEISGAVSYNAQAENTGSGVSIVGAIQYLQNGETDWKILTADSWFNKPPFSDAPLVLNIPTRIIKLNDGDKIRLIIYRQKFKKYGDEPTPKEHGSSGSYPALESVTNNRSLFVNILSE